MQDGDVCQKKKKKNMWQKYFKENTTVGTENEGPKRRGLPSFYWFPGFP